MWQSNPKIRRIGLKVKIKSLYERIEDLEFAMLDIMTQDEFTFSKEDLGL